MAEASRLPSEFVDYLTKEGLSCGSGKAWLNAYLSSTDYNGGADSAVSLIGAIRGTVKDGGNGPTLQALYGDGLDRMWRGCGSPAVISGVWQFLCRNKQQLKTVKVKAYAQRAKEARSTKVETRSGTLFDLYFEGNWDAQAIQLMVQDRFFGIDCIGFLGNYLVWVGESPDYIGYVPSLWPSRVCKIPVTKASQVKPLDILCWAGHVAIVDWVWQMLDDKIVQVDICQSSTGGPQCNSRVELKEISVGGSTQFRIRHRGLPKMPIDDHCIIQRREGFFW